MKTIFRDVIGDTTATSRSFLLEPFKNYLLVAQTTDGSNIYVDYKYMGFITIGDNSGDFPSVITTYTMGSGSYDRVTANIDSNNQLRLYVNTMYNQWSVCTLVQL